MKKYLYVTIQADSIQINKTKFNVTGVVSIWDRKSDEKYEIRYVITNTTFKTYSVNSECLPYLFEDERFSEYIKNCVTSFVKGLLHKDYFIIISFP